MYTVASRHLRTTCHRGLFQSNLSARAKLWILPSTRAHSSGCEAKGLSQTEFSARQLALTCVIYHCAVADVKEKKKNPPHSISSDVIKLSDEGQTGLYCWTYILITYRCKNGFPSNGQSCLFVFFNCRTGQFKYHVGKVGKQIY